MAFSIQSTRATARKRTVERYGSIANRFRKQLVEQLGEGGIMVLPLGPQRRSQSIVKLTRTARGLDRTDLIAVRFVPLLPGRAQEL